MLAAVEFRKDYTLSYKRYYRHTNNFFSQDAHREIRPLIHEQASFLYATLLQVSKYINHQLFRVDCF